MKNYQRKNPKFNEGKKTPIIKCPHCNKKWIKADKTACGGCQRKILVCEAIF